MPAFARAILIQESAEGGLSYKVKKRSFLALKSQKTPSQWTRSDLPGRIPAEAVLLAYICDIRSQTLPE